MASYHTDIPGYADQYGVSALKGPLWAYFRWLHNQAELNLCPSDYTLMELQQHGFERVNLWPHGGDTERFSPAHRSAEGRARLTDGHPEAPLLLYVGRLAAEKRIDWLRPILDAAPGVRLALVGEGPLRPALEQQFAHTATVFTGYLKGHDLAQAYASADLYVFPSASETFGNVVLEAMASGLPVVAARAGGPVNLVRDGVNGYLCDAARPDLFLAQTCHLAREHGERARLSQGARQYAQSQSWAKVLDDLLDDYAAVIRQQASRQGLAFHGRGAGAASAAGGQRIPRPAFDWPWRDSWRSGIGKHEG